MGQRVTQGFHGGWVNTGTEDIRTSTTGGVSATLGSGFRSGTVGAEGPLYDLWWAFLVAVNENNRGGFMGNALRKQLEPAVPTTTNSWPLDYVSVFAWRQCQVDRLRRSPGLLIGAMTYYATHPVEFINHWCNTYDPRNAGKSVPPRIPLVMFKKQEDLIRYMMACLEGEECGLIEKSRDMGATWICCAFSVWLWLFVPGAAIGWGSRKAQLVDKIGDPDSIFEKMRMIITGLPSFFLPPGFNPSEDMSFMRIVNPKIGRAHV